MSSSPDKPGPSNPYARRTPWGRTSQAPFRIGGAPAVPGAALTPLVAPAGPTRPAPPPASGEGILGSSPLLPRRPAGLPPAPQAVPPLASPPRAAQTPPSPQPAAQPAAQPAPEPRPEPAPAAVQTQPATPRPQAAAPQPAAPPPVAAPPAAPPPEQILEALTKTYERPRPPIGRRLAIAGIAVGVIALIAVAAVIMSRREAEIVDALPSGSAPVQAGPGDVPAASSTTDLPAPPIYRATLPPLAGQPEALTPPPAAAAPSTTTTTAAAPAPAPASAAPVAPPPALVIPPPPALEVPPPPAPKPAPPPAARPAEDPDAPIVLRKGEE